MDDFGPNVLGSNETATRYALINPILRVLGWDVEKPELVRLDWKQAHGLIPDYTCLKNGNPVLYVEAKKWGTNSAISKLRNPLSSYKIQKLKKYCKYNSVKIGTFTDGGSWYIIDFTDFKRPEIITFIDAANAGKKEVKKLLNISYEHL
jgi:predicted type IV restriction endonuclease